MNESWMTLDETAEYLGVRADDVRRWIDSLELPVHRLEQGLRFDVAEIEAWIVHGLEISLKRKALELLE